MHSRTFEQQNLDEKFEWRRTFDPISIMNLQRAATWCYDQWFRLNRHLIGRIIPLTVSQKGQCHLRWSLVMSFREYWYDVHTTATERTTPAIVGLPWTKRRKSVSSMSCNVCENPYAPRCDTWKSYNSVEAMPRSSYCLDTHKLTRVSIVA